MEKRARIKLIVAGIALAAGSVAAVAWHESRFPLRYLEFKRVNMARASAVRGGRSRDLEPAEIEELCRLLRSAKEIEDFEGRRTMRVRMRTVDYGRVIVQDLDGPGANLHIMAGDPRERTCTVRSGALGDFLRRIAAGLGADAEGKGR